MNRDELLAENQRLTELVAQKDDAIYNLNEMYQELTRKYEELVTDYKEFSRASIEVYLEHTTLWESSEKVKNLSDLIDEKLR